MVVARTAHVAGPREMANAGTFFDTGQSLGLASSQAISLGDVDGDTDLDAFVANHGPNQLWFNNGSAGFSSNGQNLGNQTSNDVVLEDLDGDLDLDAFLANNGVNEIWVNIGGGFFSNSGQAIGGAGTDSRGVALGDLDGDQDLDAFIANNGPNEVWLNGENGNPAGTFNNTGQLLGNLTSQSVVLANVDGDNDLDAIVANGNTASQASKIWLNDGQGNFSDSGQSLDISWNYGVAAGDLDGDGDRDILLTSWTQADTVWINQGGDQGGTLGQFSDSGQTLSGSGSLGVGLADVDADGDLDALVARWSPEGNQVWLNQGGVQGGTAGVFVNSGQSIDDSATYGVALGDLDQDTDVDVMFANFAGNTVWLNGQPGLPNPLFDVDAQLNDDGRLVYPWAQAGDAQLPVRLTNLAADPVTVFARVESDTGVITKTVPFTPGQAVNSLNVTNPQPDPSETLTLTLDIDFTTRLRAKLVDCLNLVFIDTDQGQPWCYLCFVDWMVKLMDFDTSFWKLHHVELPVLESSLAWGYYQGLFQGNSAEISTIVATNPSLLWRSFNVLESWTPAISALDAGQGSTVTIAPEMSDGLTQLFSGIAAEASPELAERITFELSALDPNSYVGLTMEEAETRLAERIQGWVYLPAVSNSLPPLPQSSR